MIWPFFPNGHLIAFGPANVKLIRKSACEVSGGTDTGFEDDNHDGALRHFMQGVGADLLSEIELWYVRSEAFDVPLQGCSARIKEPEAGGDENIWLWRWITQHDFIWNARVKFTAEQTSEDCHNLTMLFSWPIAHNNDFYVLLNDYEIDGEEVRAAFVKMVYRF